MNVLIITNSYSRVHVYYLGKALADEHNVSVLSFTRNGNANGAGRASVYSRLETVPPPAMGRARKAMLSLMTGAPVTVFSNRSDEMAKAIGSLVEATLFDVIIFEQMAMGQYLDGIEKGLRLFFPVDSISRLKEQRYNAEWSPFQRAVHWINYRFVKAYEKRLYGACDGVIFVSGKDMEYAVSKLGLSQERAYLLPISVDLDYFVPKAGSLGDKLSLIFVGNLADFKSEHAVLWFYRHCWPKVQALASEITWYVVGREPSDRVKQLSVFDPRVIVTGFVEDLRPYLDRATIFISPLQLGTGMKNRILEAMAMAKPIVATPCSLEGFAISDGQEVMVARDGDGFARAISRLLEDQQLRVSLALRAREYVAKQHSLSQLKERFLGIVERARQRNGTRSP